VESGKSIFHIKAVIP